MSMVKDQGLENTRPPTSASTRWFASLATFLIGEDKLISIEFKYYRA